MFPTKNYCSSLVSVYRPIMTTLLSVQGAKILSPDIFGHARSSGHADRAISTPCYLYMSLRDEILKSYIPHLLDARTSRKFLVFWRLERTKSWLVVRYSFLGIGKNSLHTDAHTAKNHIKMFTAVTYKKGRRSHYSCLPLLPLVPAAYRARLPDISFSTQVYRV